MIISIFFLQDRLLMPLFLEMRKNSKYRVLKHRKQHRSLLWGHSTERTGCPYKSRSRDPIFTAWTTSSFERNHFTGQQVNKSN